MLKTIGTKNHGLDRRHGFPRSGTISSFLSFGEIDGIFRSDVRHIEYGKLNVDWHTMKKKTKSINNNLTVSI